MTTSRYVELDLMTHHSFLRGASSPEELHAAAALLGVEALGVADLGTVGGVVRCWEAARTTGVRSIPGARVHLGDGRRLLLYPTDRPAWSRLSRLITLGKSRSGKTGCDLAWDDLAEWAEGLVAVLVPTGVPDAATLADMAALFGDRAHVALALHRRPDDRARLAATDAAARAAGVRPVATGAVLYHAPEPRLLQDVMTAIREKCTVDELGYPRDFAERTFRQIEGFGSYGFPESHAASFAKIAYASSWMKCHHPDVFCAALLNSQPMGFYGVAEVVGDARDHGVEVRPVCVDASRWDCTLEPTGGPRLAVRLGLRQVRGLANLHGARIVAARGDDPFGSVEEVWRRAGVPRAAIEKLAEADAFHAFAHDRRQGLWRVRGLGDAPLPLFAAADAAEAAFRPESVEEQVVLRPLADGREVVEDYRTTQLSLRAHPVSFLRDDLARRGHVCCADLAGVRDGRHVKVSGIVLVRQKPGSAKGVLFITVQDETGVANGILWPDRFEAQRRTVMSAAMVTMVGRLQKEGEVVHVIIDRIVDEGDLLRRVGGMDFPHRTGRGDGARHAGAPDRGDAGWKPTVRSDYWPPHADGMDPEDAVRVKTRDFR